MTQSQIDAAIDEYRASTTPAAVQRAVRYQRKIGSPMTAAEVRQWAGIALRDQLATGGTGRASIGISEVDALAFKILLNPEKYRTAEQVGQSGEQLMEMLMPNDKRLGDCTGAELEVIGEAWDRSIEIRRSILKGVLNETLNARAAA